VSKSNSSPFRITFVLILMAAVVFVMTRRAPEEAPRAPVRITLPAVSATPPAPPVTTVVRERAEGPAPAPGADDEVLSAEDRSEPGSEPARWIYYRDAGAEVLQIAGSWGIWKKEAMQKVAPGLWAFEIGAQDGSFGRYEFKFIVDGVWEGGQNRILHRNEAGLMERPPQMVAQALIEQSHVIRILLTETPGNPDALQIEMTPDYGIGQVAWQVPQENSRLSGYRFAGADVEFVFDPSAYDMDAEQVRTVVVAGAFSDWNPVNDQYILQRQSDNTWTVRRPYGFIDSRVTDEHILFKFLVNGQWMNPPADAPNAMLEPGTPHMNLTLPRGGAGRPELWVRTRRPIDLRDPPALILRGLHERAIPVRPTPGRLLANMYSEKPMGVELNRAAEQTTFRLFAPRATAVHLGLFDGPYHTTAAEEPVEPAERILMTRDRDGVWEHTVPGLRLGQYYAYQIEGPRGDGEGFNPTVWAGDPYALAVSLAEGNSIVKELEPFVPPALRIPWEDLVIYETHVRHFSWDPSSGVPEALRGGYGGFTATAGLGTGIDHLKRLGVNVVQFLPIHEFPNGFEPRHDWGYATGFFFAPESSFATDPRSGSQVQEFRALVRELKEHGFLVFLDVVYNHIGGVNVFDLIDRKYYFRLNPDLTKQNFSGCGNDVASEAPMMRRLIVENVLFWVEEYGIDGFRFDLGELIDNETLLEIEREIRRKHPHVVLHSEPWSFRGSHKDFLGGTSWGAWNDQFREPAKRFVVGNGDVDALKRAIRGSVESWTRHPLQSVNYMESHDDHSLTDELSLNPGRDGRQLSTRDERVHKLGATLIFGSLGTPLITECQDWLRSKHGVRNTYNRGDELNALRWGERDRPHAREVSDYYAQMIHFRLSEAGRALRVSEAPSMDYLRFVHDAGGTARETALGWIANANAERPGVPAVMVLMNAGTEEVSFEVDLPPGLWGQVGDGNQVRAEGLAETPRMTGSRRETLRVPPQTAFVYRNGF